MPYLNKVTLVGHATKDMEIRYSQSGMKVGKFAIAVNEGYGDKKKAHFFDVTAFDKTVDWSEEKLKKGVAVVVNGKLNQETWDDKTTGEKRSKVGVIAHSIGVFAKGEKQVPEQRIIPMADVPYGDEDSVPF